MLFMQPNLASKELKITWVEVSSSNSCHEWILARGDKTGGAGNRSMIRVSMGNFMCTSEWVGWVGLTYQHFFIFCILKIVNSLI